ncbi:DUF2637 domain-containing protein [Nonomuraea sp. NPDC050556]|uniref:DUF2637 domain-containing protein n=1 Tax=Nonomuraea sp. NPDC050556 TaxID=3364369 RepID=UPI003795175F
MKLWFARKDILDPEQARQRLEAERLNQERLALLVHGTRERTQAEDTGRRELAEQAAAERAQARKQAEHLRAERRAASRQRWARRGFHATLATGIVGVNAAAVLGQVLALVLVSGWPWWAALPLAIVVEAIANIVGFFSHDKTVKGYSAPLLRLLSLVIAAAIGWFNWQHNLDHPLTSGYAIVFGCASLFSPVLWQLYSGWRRWDAQREQDLLVRQKPTFGAWRWIIPSLRSETWAAFKIAVAEGITTREEALARVRTERLRRDAQAAVIATHEHALELALTQLAATADELYGPNPDPAAVEAMRNIQDFIGRFGPIVPPFIPASEIARGSDRPPIESGHGTTSPATPATNRDRVPDPITNEPDRIDPTATSADQTPINSTRSEQPTDPAESVEPSSSTRSDQTTRSSDPAPDRTRSAPDPARSDRRRTRPIEELRSEAADLIEQGALDRPVTADRLMEVLRIGPAKARPLRDQLNHEPINGHEVAP